MIPGVGDPLGRRPRRRAPDPEGLRAAGRGRHRARLRAPVRRPGVERAERRRLRRADPQRRRGHVPGQVQGQGALRALRAADGRRDPAPPRLQGGAGEGDRARADDRPVPADRRAGHGQDRRRRGARALGAPGARARPARRVRPARRGDRADRPARPPRPARGLPPGAPLAGRRDRPTVEPLRMHVNLSVAELRDPGLVENVLACDPGVRHRPGPARDRDHRVPARRRRRRGALPRAARARREDRARRLRHRLLVAVATCTRCRWTR